MAIRRWRPRQTPAQRQQRWARSMTPGAFDGEAYVPTGVVESTEAMIDGGDGENPIKHYWEILKPTGETPATTYTTFYKPLPFWPHVTMSGHGCTPGVEYTFDEDTSTLTVDPAMGLTSGDVLWVRYDYIGLAEDIALWTVLSENRDYFAGTNEHQTIWAESVALSGGRAALCHGEMVQTATSEFWYGARVTIMDSSGAKTGDLVVDPPDALAGVDLKSQVNWDLNFTNVGDEKVIVYAAMYEALSPGYDYYLWMALVDCSGGTPSLLDVYYDDTYASVSSDMLVKSIDANHAIMATDDSLFVVDVTGGTISVGTPETGGWPYVSDALLAYDDGIGIVVPVSSFDGPGGNEATWYPFQIDGSYNITIGTPIDSPLSTDLYLYTASLDFSPTTPGLAYVAVYDNSITPDPGRTGEDLKLMTVTTDGSTISFDAVSGLLLSEDYDNSGGSGLPSWVNVVELSGETYAMVSVATAGATPPGAIKIIKDPMGTPTVAYLADGPLPLDLYNLEWGVSTSGDHIFFAFANGYTEIWDGVDYDAFAPAWGYALDPSTLTFT